MQTIWDQRFARRVQRMRPSAIRELLKVTELPNAISFAGGLPAPENFPIEKIAETAQRVLQTAGPQALQYSATEGYRPLRELIARRMSQDGLEVATENVLITSGSQQALDLLGKVLIDPGDTILVESPTYMGALHSWNPYEPEYLALSSDQHGLITETDALETALRANPKFIYVLPNFQNPTGVTLSMERRHQLIEITNRYGVPIVEDDAYIQLSFSGEPLPSLMALDAATREPSNYDGNVIYLGSFSKVLAPGFRIGWIIAPTLLIRRLIQAKQGADLHSSTLNQMIAYNIVQEGFLEQHIPRLRQVYRERRDIMLAELEEHFPETVHWTHPEGGMFLWVTLPEELDAIDVLREAIEQNVTFVPGATFHANGGGANTFRLSFSNPSPEKIREGIARLGRALRKTLAQQATSPR